METRKLILSTVLFSLSVICCPQGIAQSDTLRSDDVPTTPTEKRKALLTPNYYANWLGADFFTIASIEKECDVKPVRIIDLTFFYDFGECFVGMEALENGVVVQMTLRLFGEKADDFIREAKDYGFAYLEDDSENITRSDAEGITDIYTSQIKRYRKKTKNGNVYIDVSTSGRFAGEYDIAIYRAE